MVRSSVSALLLVAALPCTGHAAWLWVYNGEKHVVMPPREGQPEWASYPDANDDGKPDPIITHIDFRVESQNGEPVGKSRVGETIHLVAAPELGGLELETLTVRFHLTGPRGEVEVAPEDAIRNPRPLGTAPAIYRATYAIPEEPVEDHVGEYEATVDVELGSARSTPEMTSIVQLRVVGPRETTPERIAREVRAGLQRAGEELSDFGERVAREVGAWLDEKTQPPPPGTLHVVHERATRGMIEKFVEGPAGPPAADRDALARDRGAALQSRTGPARSVLVVPFENAREALPDGSSPIGYLAMGGLRPSGPAGGQALSDEDELTCYRIVLQGNAEGETEVGILSADATRLVALPVRAGWFNRLPWPRESYLKSEREPGPDTDGLISVELVSAVGGGAVRAVFTLPVVSMTPVATGEEEPTTPEG